jgi:hypothetical protein
MPADLDYPGAGVPVRDELRAAHRFIWEYVRAPGNWWTGEQRVAIGAELRAATRCRLCAARKSALSPNAVAGEHDAGSTLPPAVVDIVHRIRTDPGRLSRAWFDSITDPTSPPPWPFLATGKGQGGGRQGGGRLPIPAYVELVAVVTFITGVDFFCRSLDIDPFPLPEPLPGEPSRHLPASARADTAWVPMIDPQDASGPEADMYPPAPFIPNIVRALSLVPDAVRGLRRLSDAHYLPVAQIGDPTARRPELDRLQTELIAARVSALNQCFY